MTENNLKQALQQPYELATWQNLLRNILPNTTFLMPTAYQPLFENTDFVKKAFQFGATTLNDGKRLALIDVQLSDNKVIARNRVELRNLAAKLIDYGQFAGLLVWFHSEKQQEYRFSFISKSSSFNEDGELSTTQTAAKRYSFLLGPNEACTTPARRLLVTPISSLETLLEAFSVEKLNNDFFKGYKEFYEKFWRYLNSQADYRNLLIDKDQAERAKAEKPIRDFAKKLLGRIVFLYFLQKKGWMGSQAADSGANTWGNGDSNFIKNLFQDFADKPCFYSQILTKLFFETLNIKRKDDLFTHSGGRGAGRVPYLNGGLFDNDLPQTNHFDFPESYFQDLFAFFDQYNFTIDENDPDDAHVGIDPEMLGHIFENLLEENENKTGGVFYTPKEIVQYMCQESLIQYLSTHLSEAPIEAVRRIDLGAFIRHSERGDAKGFITKNARKIERLLDNVKICDPAIGSGAFPMGMLQEIFKAKMTLDLTLDPAETKRHIIQNSIYGVDLDKGAVDIARLRFWLALVVDEETPSPLPNLDYKIMQGNSLLESFEGIPLNNLQQTKTAITLIEGGQQLGMFGNTVAQQTRMEFLDSKRQDLEDLIDTYFDLESEQKPAIKQQINDIVHEHLHYNVDLKLAEVETKIGILAAEMALITIYETDNNSNRKKKQKALDTKQKALENLQKEAEKLTNALWQLDKIQETDERPYFLWHLFFKDVFTPTGQSDGSGGGLGGFDIVIGNPPYVRQEALGDIKPILEKAYPKTYKGTADLLVYFVELGYNLMKPKGVFAYIISNKWIRAGYGEGMRKLLLENRMLELIDFGDLPVFEGATAYPCIVRFQKDVPSDAFAVTVATKIPQKVGLLSHVAKNQFMINITALDPSGWQLNNRTQQNLLEKLNRNAQTLEKYLNGEAYRGVLTGLSEAFVIDEKTRKRLIEEDKSSEEVIKPLLMGRDISKYSSSKTINYILYIPWHFPLHLDKTIKGIPPHAEELFRTQYPAIYNHLFQYKKQLLNRNKAETGIRYAWYAMQRWGAEYWEEFSKPKIMYQKFQVKPCFIYDEEGLYCNDSMWIIPTTDKFLLGILNSKVGWYAITQYCTKIQNGYQLIYDYLRKIPIAIPTEIQKNQIETLVNQILILKKENQPTLHLEAEIDQLVYALYELTAAEIAIVEGR